MAEYKVPEEEPNIKVPKFEESAGFYTNAARSKQMSKIRGKNTKPEMLLRRSLFAAGVRFHVQSLKLIGKPDIAIKKYCLAIFVDGEFWHGYDWEKRKNELKSNRNFWIPKIERNMQRDRQVNKALAEKGYQVFRFWSKDVLSQPGVCVQEILRYVEEQKRYGKS